MNVELRVTRGMALLDTAEGLDWVWHIDLSTLRMSDGEECILGQLFGDYWEGARRLGRLTSPDDGAFAGHVYGFDVDAMEEMTMENTDEFRLLDAAWYRRIQEMRTLIPACKCDHPVHVHDHTQHRLQAQT